PNSNKSSRQNLRPGQDFIVTKKQASQFPGIGITLSSYQKSKDGQDIIKPTTVKRSFFKKIFNKKAFKRFILTVLLLGVIAGIFFGGRILYDLRKAFGGNIFDLLHTSRLKGEDNGRVTFLLAGNSPDDPQHGGANLTDSIMLVSINTKNNTAWMLSIPRDLWVKVPSHGYQKINAVYEEGQNDNFSASGYPNGGMGELEQIVSQKFAIPINYYALINYTAFKQAVDAVGGISVNIHSSDPRGLFDAYTNLKLPNGQVNLNGQQALSLARARGDNSAGDISYGFNNSDFDRTLHQREMLLSLKNKATSGHVLANPIALSNLFDALGNNVKTDFTLGNARRLLQLSKAIPSNKIKSLSLNNSNGINLLTSYHSSDGQDALIPSAGINNYSDIDAYVAKYTSNNPLVQEGARVVVLNGTNTYGLANKYKQKLVSNFINVDQTGDAINTAHSEIIDLSLGKMPATKAALIKVIGNNFATSNPYPKYQADFIIVLGSDANLKL
ncbi:MAG TPA: LCP family protein, partial [Patescibacteria group bacterium]|nr:LCP family protein [Patescibacteria group bacterium]